MRTAGQSCQGIARWPVGKNPTARTMIESYFGVEEEQAGDLFSLLHEFG